jgi:hypothetical protein
MYVHVMDAGMGEVDFFDAEIAGLGVNEVSTQEPETTSTPAPTFIAEVA